MSGVTIDTGYLLRVLRELIAIDSALPHEARLAAYVADELRALGLEPEWHEVAPGRPNVYATADFGPGGRFLVFSGHSDTVPPAAGWQTDPYTLTERDGRLYGLGVVNMKGGIACQLAALAALLESGSGERPRSGRLGFALTVDQEGHSIGARALLGTKYGRCDAMLHAEHFFGSSESDYLPIAVTGKVLYHLTVRGRAAHGFRPHLGINAVDDAARIVTALDRLRRRDDPRFGRGTVCTLNFEGGYGQQYAMVVPERCQVVITRLAVPGETREVAIADMRELVDSLGLRSEVEIAIPAQGSYDPYELAPDTPILSPFQAAYREVTGQAPHWAGHRGIVDANVFVAEGGIPTICFGPRGGLHHSPEEYLDGATLEPVARIHAETALRYLDAAGERGVLR